MCWLLQAFYLNFLLPFFISCWQLSICPKILIISIQFTNYTLCNPQFIPELTYINPFCLLRKFNESICATTRLRLDSYYPFFESTKRLASFFLNTHTHTCTCVCCGDVGKPLKPQKTQSVSKTETEKQKQKPKTKTNFGLQLQQEQERERQCAI